MDIFIYFYSIIYVILHIFIIVHSLIKNKEYENNDRYKPNDVDNPFISIVCSAFNEEVTIIPCVMSFLNQNYNNFEVIVVNDGSSDNTSKKLIEEFSLKEIDIKTRIKNKLEYETINKIYVNGRLTLIEKKNGGLSDGQNAGCDVARGEYVLISDADCYLDKQTLYNTIYPILEDSNIVGVGGIIQMINNCKIDNEGNIIDKTIPKSLYGKFQVLEYLKSYLLSRMSLQSYKNVIIASGAYGLFKKEILYSVGGFMKGSLAEDMDITIKINKYCYENDINKKQVFIPSTNIWTEVPESFSNLYKQRTRWGAGYSQCLYTHKDIFKKKYGKMGFLMFPYSIIFNWLTPIVEIASIFYFILIRGDFSYLLLFLILGIYTFGVISNIIAVTLNYNREDNISLEDYRRLVLLSFIEPILYHWIVSFITVIGYIKFFIGNEKHNVLTRAGFNILG